jgi:hypothetical protein
MRLYVSYSRSLAQREAWFAPSPILRAVFLDMPAVNRGFDEPAD